MQKNAIALGGGGAKGAYEIGVFEALSDLEFKYDIITGTSVGSINGAVIAQGDISLAKKMWKEISTNEILDLNTEIPENELEAYKIMTKELMSGSSFDYSNLRKLLEEIIDEKKLRASSVEFGLVTVKFPSMTPLYIFKEEMEKGKIIDYILASAAFFPAMKPHKIGKELYIDGGYHDNLPINMAIKKGATTVVSVNLNAVGVIKKIKNKNVKIINITSYSDLGNMLIFEKKRARKNMKLGYLDTIKAFGKAEGYRYTFKKGELKKNFENMQPQITAFFKEYFKNDLLKYSKIIKQCAYINCKSRLKSTDKLTKEVYLNVILENTMELLKIPMFEAYSIRKAHFTIKNKFKSIKKTGIDSIIELIPGITDQNIFNPFKNDGRILSDNIFSLIQNIDYSELSARIKDIIANNDNISIVKYICDLFDGDINEKRGLIITFLLFTPMQFFSAVYIKTLLTQ